MLSCLRPAVFSERPPVFLVLQEADRDQPALVCIRREGTGPEAVRNEVVARRILLLECVEEEQLLEVRGAARLPEGVEQGQKKALAGEEHEGYYLLIHGAAIVTLSIVALTDWELSVGGCCLLCRWHPFCFERLHVTFPNV